MPSKYEIEKTWEFEAGHHLENLREGHKCARPHGHNYELTVCLSAKSVDEKTGFVVDYFEMDRMMEPVIASLDHQNLNELELFSEANPTAENIAAAALQYVLDRAHKLWNVGESDPEQWVRVEWVQVRENRYSLARVYP